MFVSYIPIYKDKVYYTFRRPGVGESHPEGEDDRGNEEVRDALFPRLRPWHV